MIKKEKLSIIEIIELGTKKSQFLYNNSDVYDIIQIERISDNVVVVEYNLIKQN